MSLLYTLRILADIAFVMTFAHFVGVGILGGYPMWGLVPLWAAVAWACAALHGRGRHALRGLPLLLLAAPMLWLPLSPVNAALVLLPSSYIIYAVLTRRGMAGQVQYLSTFYMYLKIAIPFATVAMLPTVSRQHLAAYALPFVLLFLACAVTLMRMARHDPQVRSRPLFQLINAVGVLGVLAGGALLAGPWVRSVVGGLLVGVLRHGVHPLWAMLINAITFIMGAGLARLPDIEPFTPEHEIDLLGGAEEAAEYVANEPTQFFLYAGILLLAIPAVLLLIWLYRRLTTLHIEPAAPSGIHEQFTPVPKAAPSKTRTRDPLRRIYQRFLRLCHRRLIAPKPGYTSHHYATLATTKLSLTQEAHNLRTLYLPTRYSHHPTQKPNVAAAKELYKKMRSSK